MDKRDKKRRKRLRADEGFLWVNRKRQLATAFVSVYPEDIPDWELLPEAEALDLHQKWYPEMYYTEEDIESERERKRQAGN